MSAIRLSSDVEMNAQKVAKAMGLGSGRAAIEAVFRCYWQQYISDQNIVKEAPRIPTTQQSEKMITQVIEDAKQSDANFLALLLEKSEKKGKELGTLMATKMIEGVKSVNQSCTKILIETPDSINPICLDPETLAIVDLIQVKTRTTNPASAISLMVERYGRHILEDQESTAITEPFNLLKIEPRTIDWDELNEIAKVSDFYASEVSKLQEQDKEIKLKEVQNEAMQVALTAMERDYKVKKAENERLRIETFKESVRARLREDKRIEIEVEAEILAESDYRTKTETLPQVSTPIEENESKIVRKSQKDHSA